ncbi:cubilin-like [Ptychodera flava]|uniref:cubilin-like n=1 Tax=Ptychodera flava TaxID=63121 RepID=UPI00396A4C3B
MTIQHCLNFCQGKYLFAGINNGTFCYCGNPSYKGDELLPNEKCNTPCTGSELQSCGGPSSVGLYKGSMGICDSNTSIRKNNGFIYSPGYPGSYGNHLLNCSWYITTTKTFIRSRFVIFALRNVQDTVIIDDMSMTQSQRLHYTKLNGSNPTIPDMLSNEMKITFKTLDDTNSTRSIFVIEFEARNCNQTTLVTGQEGRIYSRGLPKCYESENVKTWNILAPNGTVIESALINCKLSHKSVSVVITEVVDGNETRTYTCEEVKQSTFVSTSNHLVIVLQSSKNGKSSDEATFTIEWKAVLKSYTVKRTGRHGILMSPFYPYPFPSHMFYTWYVTTDKDSLVKILFIELFLREKDFLEIGDSDGHRSSLGRYNSSNCCGLPKVPYSKSNQVVVGLSSEKEAAEVKFLQEGRIAIVYYGRHENGGTEDLGPTQGKNDTFKCCDSPTNATIFQFNGTQDEELPMNKYIAIGCGAGSAFIVTLILLITCWRSRMLCGALTSNTQNTKDVTLATGRQKRAMWVAEDVELKNIKYEKATSYSNVPATSAEQTYWHEKQPSCISLISPDSGDGISDTTTRPSPNEAIEGVNGGASGSVSVRHCVINGISDIDFEEAGFKDNEIYEDGDDFEVVEYAEMQD